MKTDDVKKAVESDTLFIHSSPTGGSGSMSKAKATSNTSHALELLGGNISSDKCTRSCGSSVSRKRGTATVCDRSCSPGEHGPRFAGLNCGAGNTEKFGENCRVCYNDLGKAKEAEEKLAQRNALRGMGLTQEHVIMCETLLPPPTSACNSKCTMDVDTVRFAEDAFVLFEGQGSRGSLFRRGLRFYRNRNEILSAESFCRPRSAYRFVFGVLVN